MFNKKMSIILLCSFIMIGIVGCGNNNQKNSSLEDSTSEEESSDLESSTNEEENSDVENGTDIEESSVTYRKYKIQDIMLELPEEWNIQYEEDGLEANFESDTVAFGIQAVSLGPYEDLWEFRFEYYCETENLDALESAGATLVEISKNTYSNYDAYDYEGEVLIQGKMAKVKSTVLYSEGYAINIMLVYGDDDYDYENIYDYMSNSIE